MKAAMSVRRVTRGRIPANIPLTPALWLILRRVCTSPELADCSWTPVLTTSAGWVMMDASKPAITPHEKSSGGARVSVCVAARDKGGYVSNEM